LAAGLMLSGCMQTTYEATNANNFKPHDKELLAKVSYVRPGSSPSAAIVDYHRKGSPRLDRGRSRTTITSITS
jgi:hypothetical protein